MSESNKTLSPLLPTMWDSGIEPTLEDTAKLRKLVVQLSALAIKNVMDQTKAAAGLTHYCAKNECANCTLEPNMASCLRHKAKICMRLSTTFSGKKRFALEKISLDLMQEANAKAA